MTGQRRPRLVGPRVHLCVPDLRSGPRDDCPNVLHDFPLPEGYTDASEAAGNRLRNRWANKECPDCGRYGWEPGDPTGDPCDERVPAHSAGLPANPADPATMPTRLTAPVPDSPPLD